MKQQGFSLIEVLVALGIAAVALVALMGRLGISADTQLTLGRYATAMDVARNVIESERAQAVPPVNDTSGDEEISGQIYHWRASTEETQLGLMVRRNIEVSIANEPPIRLFYYHEVPEQ